MDEQAGIYNPTRAGNYVTISRRSFIKGFSGLAAASVCSRGLGLVLADREEQRLRDMMRLEGVIRNQKFLFDDGLILDWRDQDARIEDCEFVFRQVTRPDMLRLEAVSGLNVDRCNFRSLTENKVRSYVCVTKECSNNAFFNCNFEGLEAYAGVFFEAGFAETPSFGGSVVHFPGWKGRIHCSYPF